jgi:biopolymer transport protein ExbD
MSSERIVLNVSPGGRVKWGKEKFLLDNQKETAKGIKKIIALGTNNFIEIRADPRAESGRILRLVDALRVAGFEKIHIAVFSDVNRK